MEGAGLLEVVAVAGKGRSPSEEAYTRFLQIPWHMRHDIWLSPQFCGRPFTTLGAHLHVRARSRHVKHFSDVMRGQKGEIKLLQIWAARRIFLDSSSRVVPRVVPQGLPGAKWLGALSWWSCTEAWPWRRQLAALILMPWSREHLDQARRGQTAWPPQPLLTPPVLSRCNLSMHVCAASRLHKFFLVSHFGTKGRAFCGVNDEAPSPKNIFSSFRADVHARPHGTAAVFATKRRSRHPNLRII